VLACCPAAVATPNYLASARKRGQATMTPTAIMGVMRGMYAETP